MLAHHRAQRDQKTDAFALKHKDQLRLSSNGDKLPRINAGARSLSIIANARRDYRSIYAPHTRCRAAVVSLLFVYIYMAGS